MPYASFPMWTTGALHIGQLHLSPPDNGAFVVLQFRGPFEPEAMNAAILAADAALRASLAAPPNPKPQGETP